MQSTAETGSSLPNPSCLRSTRCLSLQLTPTFHGFSPSYCFLQRVQRTQAKHRIPLGGLSGSSLFTSTLAVCTHACYVRAALDVTWVGFAESCMFGARARRINVRCFPPCLSSMLGSPAGSSGEGVKVFLHPTTLAMSKNSPSLATLPLSFKETLLKLPSFCQHRACFVINN